MDHAKEQHKVNDSSKENIADKEPCKVLYHKNKESNSTG